MANLELEQLEEIADNINGILPYESDMAIEDGQILYGDDILPYIDFLLDGIPKTLELSKEGYSKYEELCESAEFNYIKDNYEMSIGYDGSGYEYWTKQQEENNYITLTITVKNELTEEDYDEIETVTKSMENQLDDISRNYKDVVKVVFRQDHKTHQQWQEVKVSHYDYETLEDRLTELVADENSPVEKVGGSFVHVPHEDFGELPLGDDVCIDVDSLDDLDNTTWEIRL